MLFRNVNAATSFKDSSQDNVILATFIAKCITQGYMHKFLFGWILLVLSVNLVDKVGVDEVTPILEPKLANNGIYFIFWLDITNTIAYHWIELTVPIMQKLEY